jgi:hypothetical protein
MQKFTLVLVIGLLFFSGLVISNLASEKYDPEELGFESTEEKLKSMGINKHPSDNDFDIRWDNFDSGDVIADDVSGLTFTDSTNDLDDDGLPEIICSDEDGFTYVFENTGDNSFDLVWSMEVVTSPGSHGYAPVVIADMDGDGLQEIVATFEDSAGIYFFEWDGIAGSDIYTEVAFLDLPYDDYDNTRSMIVDNIDSDLNQELIIAHSDTCYVFEADASFNFNNESKMWGITLDEIQSVVTADLNNNGAKEVIFCEWNYSAIYIWENTAEDTYVYVLPDTVVFQIDSEDERAYQMIITNIDGDSYPELFAVTSSDKLIVFEMQSSSWDTSSTNMMRTELLDIGSDINGIASGDIDEDGNPDLYFVTGDNHVYDWEYTGGDIFDTLNYVQYDIGELNGADAEEIVYAGDMDGDGERDFVVGYEGSSSYPLLYFLEHHELPALTTLSILRNDFYFDHLWNLADVDTELVVLENIGTEDLVVDSIVASDPVFNSYLSNTTVPALGSEVMELYFTALDQSIHDSSFFIIYSNSNSSPDTINVYGDSRARPDLFINEFQPDATEWVELLNEGVTTIDLTDIGITHGENAYSPAYLFGTPEWGSIEYFAEDTNWGPTQSIASGDFLVSFTTSVPFSENQEWAYLVFRDSSIIQRVAYGAVGGAPFFHLTGGDSITGGSISRVANTGNLATDWTVDFDATPGWQNDAVSPALGSSIVINEIDFDGDIVSGFEHVEFYNPTSSDIQMLGWKFTDGDALYVMDTLLVSAGEIALFADASMTIGISDVAYLFDDNDVRVDQVGFMTANPTTDKLAGTLQRIPDGAGPNDGYDYWTSGGDTTWFDRTHTLGSLNVEIHKTAVIFTAQVGGESSYRSFWVNGSWDSTGAPDPIWSGGFMLELKNDGFWPDSFATDDIFSGAMLLFADSTYDWWVGSENDTNSWMENGTQINPDTSIFNYSDTCIVDPSNTGFNQWNICVAGDTINGWNNTEDNLTRSGWEWSGNFSLPAGLMEFKFVVMHSSEASYGNGGIGSGFPNYQYNVPVAGDYTIIFNDSTDTYTIAETVYEENYTITTPELTTAVTNEGTIGMLNSSGGSPGFEWLSSNYLYEGALMFGMGTNHVVDGARARVGGSQGNLDADFQFLSNINVIVDNADSTVLETSFDDSRADLPPLADDGPNIPIGLEINQTTYCYSDSVNSGYVIYKLEISNTTGSQLDGIVAGAYFDWDVDGATYDQNTGAVSFENVQIAGINGGNPYDAEFSYIWNANTASFGYVGSVPLSQNYFLASRIANQPSEVYDLMTEANKFNYMSERRATDPYGPGGANDDKGIFFGLGGGTGGTGTVPDTGFSIPAGGTVTVGFAIVGGDDLADFIANGTTAVQKWADLGNNIIVFEFVTGIEDEMFGIPDEFALHQNYPNPFNPSTTIKYDLKHNTNVKIKVYDMLGREIKTVINENQTAGYKKAIWDGTNNSGQKISTGLYFYKLVTGDFVKTRKMVFIK